jgi:uncharacterized protein YjdB
MTKLKVHPAGYLSIFVILTSACGPQVKSISVQPESVTLLGAPSTATLQITVKDEDGAMSMALAQEVVWTTSNAAVAKVEKGKVSEAKITAVGPGDAVISATIGKVSGKTTVTVVVPASVEVEPAGWEGAPGQSAAFNAHVKDKAGSQLKDITVEWSVDNPQVASVTSDGHVSAVGPGEATLTASYKALTGTAKITVKSAAQPVSKVAVKPAKLALKKGAKAVLTATALNSKGKPISGVLFSWNSSDPSVAQVSKLDGKVTALKKGKAKIVAQVGDKTGAAQVVVKK